jgi:hypothetical protein
VRQRARWNGACDIVLLRRRSSLLVFAKKNNAARILTKPAPNAIHPDWTGDSFVGTGWTFIPKKVVSNVMGQYALGDLRGSAAAW